jgi:cold shock CspA family protein
MAYALRTFKGTVTRCFPEKGYGYLREDISRREAHWHVRDFEDRTGGHDIQIGMPIEFYLEAHAKGLRAIRCKRIEHVAQKQPAASISGAARTQAGHGAR